MVTDADREWLSRRRTLNNFMLWAAGGLLVVWLIVWTTMWATQPLLANPMYVVAAMDADEVEQATVETLALMCPVVFNLAGFLMMALLGSMVLWSLIERRHLGITAGGEQDGQQSAM